MARSGMASLPAASPASARRCSPRPCATLERDGLVTRTVTASVPVRVDYALTPLGHELFPVMIAIKDWAETHMDRVFEARTQYDARP